MDKMEDSGSSDTGSIPVGATIFSILITKKPSHTKAFLFASIYI